MKKLYSCLLVLSIFLLATEGVFAQRSIGQYRGNINAFNKNKRYWIVGGSLNAFNYFGDLAPKSRIASTEISFTRPGIGLTAQYRMGPVFSIRGSFMWGRLKGDDDSSEFDGGDDSFRHFRNVHFRNDIKELSAIAVFDIKGHSRTFITRPDFIPYVFAGIAVLHHNPRAQVPEYDYVHYPVTSPYQIQSNDPNYRDGKGNNVSPEEWIALRSLQTEGRTYSNFAFAIPVGAGVRYKVNRYWDLSFEVSYRQTFTDYLDDVSKSYLNPEDYDQIHAGNPERANLARIMAYRSNELSADPVEWLAIQEFQGVLERPWTNPITGSADTYTFVNGYGVQHPENIRGKDDKDVYLVTSFTLTYILGTNIRNAKFR
jgi:opacity protein-like surface antigen